MLASARKMAYNYGRKSLPCNGAAWMPPCPNKEEKN